jgi:hypothetical protein
LPKISGGDSIPRYGRRVSFLRPDRQPAAKPLTVTEIRAGYQALEDRLKWWRCENAVVMLKALRVTWCGEESDLVRLTHR